MPRERGALRTVDFLGVFWRSFLLQASWSYDRMQSLGFAFALIPVLRRLYGNSEEFSRRLAVHMEYFNTQPYFASFILGAAARLEEDRAGGDAAADPSEMKKTLMAPLGALGDSFFWGSFKPLAAAAAVGVLLTGTWWAPLLFLALYNALHLGLRWILIIEGYRLRGDVVALMATYNFTRLARRFKMMSLAVIGVVVGTFPIWGPWRMELSVLAGCAVAFTGLAASTALLAVLRIGGTPVQLMIAMAAFCLGLAMGGII